MDVAEEWTERIARRLTPAELSFAPEIGLAYAAGGRRRRDLLPRYDIEPGAFGPGGAAELPFLLQSLEQAYRVLRDLVSSPSLGNALATGILLVAVRDSREAANDGSSRPENDGSSPAQEVPVPVSERLAIERAFDTLNGRLRAAGFRPERATELTYGLLAELLSDTVGAAAYLDALAAAPSPGKSRWWTRISRHADRR
jgi:hypothetical protein